MVERKFPGGYRLLPDGRLGIVPSSLKHAKDRVREIARRNRGIDLDRMIDELNSFLTGWVSYFRYAACKRHLKQLDEWISRKSQCVRLKQRKRAKPIADFLQRLGVLEWRAWLLVLSGKAHGWQPSDCRGHNYPVVQRVKACKPDGKVCCVTTVEKPPDDDTLSISGGVGRRGCEAPSYPVLPG